MKRLIPLILAVILILPACTTQEGGENMANMLYNGVELPDINTVWTDKTKYPYAMYANGDGDGLILSSIPFTNTAEHGVTNTEVCSAAAYLLTDGKWVLADEGELAQYAVSSNGSAIVWSSYDVLNEDGTVFFAASEPVPVGSDHVKHLSGDGMALYNGVMLPKLPDWDKETYPVAFIDEYDMSVVGGSGKMFQLSCIDSSVYWADGLVASSSGSRIQCYHFTVKSDADIVGIPYDGTWTSFTSDSFDSGATIALAPFWSNIDLLREDDSVYLPTSDPIPLDGMNVITWDGVTDGLVQTTDNTEIVRLYQITDATPDSSALNSGVFSSGGTTDYLAGYVETDPSTTLICFGGAWFVVPTDGIECESVVFPKAGIWTAMIQPFILAYPASSDALDFSNTELSIYDPNVTANSADFAVDWTGLPVTTSNHVHYFLSGELDDGTQAANSPVYLFSSDVAADGEHELIFQDLEPNTEYTVTARLLYNTTWDRSDLTDSGVKATFDFTTLADGGFDRNSFLLGLASGLGKTAAMKADADHNAWAQGYVVGEALWKML